MLETRKICVTFIKPIFDNRINDYVDHVTFYVKGKDEDIVNLFDTLVKYRIYFFKTINDEIVCYPESNVLSLFMEKFD